MKLSVFLRIVIGGTLGAVGAFELLKLPYGPDRIDVLTLVVCLVGLYVVAPAGHRVRVAAAFGALVGVFGFGMLGTDLMQRHVDGAGAVLTTPDWIKVSIALAGLAGFAMWLRLKPQDSE